MRCCLDCATHCHACDASHCAAIRSLTLACRCSSTCSRVLPQHCAISMYQTTHSLLLVWQHWRVQHCTSGSHCAQSQCTAVAVAAAMCAQCAMQSSDAPHCT